MGSLLKNWFAPGWHRVIRQGAQDRYNRFHWVQKKFCAAALDLPKPAGGTKGIKAG
jgi:hypothetical protein